MKYIIQWRATTPKGKVVTGSTEVDNENRGEARRIFERSFFSKPESKKYKTFEITGVKQV